MKSTQKKRNVHGQLENFAFGIQCNLYSTDSCWEFVLGGNPNFKLGVRGNANLNVFRYQHVCIPNAKLWRWGSKPTQGHNANGFPSQWNIGFTLVSTCHRKRFKTYETLW